MKTLTLGNLLKATRIGQGCMRLSEDRNEAMATVRAALDGGITFFDHADIYAAGQREATFAAIWSEKPNLRQQVVIQSKCGIRSAGDTGPKAPARYDFSCEHIVEAVEGSLRRLKTDYLDTLLLHRPDPLVEPQEVARAFDQLQNQGKVRFFGVSNHTAAQIELLKTAVEQPLIANQLQFAITHTQMLDEGVSMNRADGQPSGRSEGTLEYCRLHNITIQAWSPLAGGYLSGRALESNPDAVRVSAPDSIRNAAAVVAELAAEKGVAPEAIVVAWILRHPAQMQVIIGTTTPSRIAGACQADAIELTREEWYRLYEAGRGMRVP